MRETFTVLLIVWVVGLEAGRGQSVRPGWGPTPYADSAGTGVTFRTWAPNAGSVAVAGPFNDWSTSSLALVHEGDGVWSLDVAAARTGERYKYVINGSLWRRDPHARAHQAAGSRNSLIHDAGAFDWGDHLFSLPSLEELVAYEMHIGTFHGEGGGSGSFESAMAKLDHLAWLGVNAVEVMPVNDFATTTSWGYNPSHPYAISPVYGSPDEFREFVRACHARGIAVLLDVVHNHWGPDSNDWTLWRYDGTGTGDYGGPFFYEGPDFCCTQWGPRPDYSSEAVRRYIAGTFRMWKDEYRVDGFRWDSPKYMLFNDSAKTQPIPDGHLLVSNTLAMLRQDYPGTLNISEDIEGFEGFDGHWDMRFQSALQTFVTRTNDADRDVHALASVLNGGGARMIYAESHDTTGDLNSGRRLPARIDAATPESYAARKRSILAGVVFLTAPGIPMIWQGQEMLETRPFSSSLPLDWTRTNSFSHVNQFFRDAIRLRRNLDGVSRGLTGAVYETLLLNNADNVLAYRRGGASPSDEDVVVVLHASGGTRPEYAVPFPAAGAWHVHLNTDNPAYGADFGGIGSDVVMATGSPPSGSVSLGPYSAQILSRVPPGGIILESVDMRDAPQGNHDGIPDPGETILCTVHLRNAFETEARDIEIALSSGQDGLAFPCRMQRIPRLAPVSAASNSYPVSFSIPADWPVGEAVLLTVEVSAHGSTNRYDLNRSTGEAVFDAASDADGDGLPDWWELHYFGGPTNATPAEDSDGDGMSNLEEYLAGTDPMDMASRLRVEPGADELGGDPVLVWPSAPGRFYGLLRASTLTSAVFTALATNIAATPPLNVQPVPLYEGGHGFFRIRLE